MNPQPPKIDRILAVDDSPDNLFLMQTILETEGYEISLVGDGITALAEIEKSPPDLVLLDVMMPKMDGYEVTRRIRQNAKSFIPILLITAHEQPSAVEGLDSGADDFIRKPLDIGELLARVRSLLRLKHSIDEQNQMVRQRENFVSLLTHDLRTPLVAANRMLNLLQQGAFGTLPDPAKEAIAPMIESNQNLLQMVNTVLEVYRHEAGSKTLTLVPLDLGMMIKTITTELAPLAAEKELTLTLDLGEEIEPFQQSQIKVMGDSVELRRVLTNLIGNAIKFTDRGSVTVRLRVTPTGSASGNGKDSSSWVTVAIHDTGQGISPEDRVTLFERFRQGKHKRSGSGLGLHLSYRIVEAHHGKIEVTSELGQGSLFTVYLPAQT
ncbi:MAG TPA: hybrid sensor histidine kinase/response regulator [Cyanobacteria bacterium UBA8803]|nr:hybrid sensor histidine kinase/response regulator [Cyanobacteria bacterium UBA9273]HBL60847.1 hybrid sensor histidine kinase/response regulator [Cyanobacteria bacterium UBA8803]